jgi:predicted nuclease of predicted toxin-antitoxin system
MIIWIDAQLSPALAKWIETTLGVQARAIRDVGLRDATDREIFRAAAAADAIVMTKDSDFVTLHYQLGRPPRIILAHMREHMEPILADLTDEGVAQRPCVIGGGRGSRRDQRALTRL